MGTDKGDVAYSELFVFVCRHAVRGPYLSHCITVVLFACISGCIVIVLLVL